MSKMKASILTVALLATAGASDVQADEKDKPALTVIPAGSQPSVKGPAEYFTGSVRVDPLFSSQKDATGTHISVANVTFEPGARTAWHTHPWGQVLVVSAGAGRVQAQGGSVQKIRPGDVVWIPAGVKHWHGAAPTAAMTHMSIVVPVDGGSAQWMEKVTEKQYDGN